MPKTLDITQFSAGQIVLAFFIVFCVIIALGTMLPKITSSLKNVWNLVNSVFTQKQKTQERNAQIDKNTKDIDDINQKLDEIVITLSTIVSDNKKSNEEIIKKVEKLEKNNIVTRIEQNRSLIMNFINSCKNKHLHSIGEYQNIFKLAENYHNTIAEYEIDNGAFEIEYEWFKRHYQWCCDRNNFLNMEEDELHE